MECVSDRNPFDDEPDFIKEAEEWLVLHPESRHPEMPCNLNQAREIIEGLLAYIKEEI